MSSLRGGLRAGLAPFMMTAVLLASAAVPRVAHATTAPPRPAVRHVLADVTTYAQSVSADAPVAYWRLGEASGTSAADASGHGLSGTYTGGVTLGVAGALTGDADTAVSLDGSSGYVSVSDSPALDLGNGPMSVELWLKTSAPGPAALIDKGPGAYGLSIDSDPSPGGDGLYPILWRLNAYTVVAVSNVGVTDGAWHHVVATRSADGTDNHLYIDGVDETVAGDTATMSDSAQDLRIGQSYGLDAPFAGSLDEVALYDHVLTLAQVVAHHDAGTPPPPPPTGYAAAVLADAPVAYWRLGEASGTSAADASGHGLSGTYTGGVTLGVAGALTGDADTAVSLDGSSGYVSVSDSPALDLGNGPMSVELWLKTSAPGPAALIDKGPGAYGLSIDSDPSPGGDGLYPILWRLNAYTVVAVSNVGVTDGAWHHVVATRSADGTDNHLYIDGVDETVAGDTATMSDSAQDLRIGQSYGLDAPFAGSLDEVALYDHVLTLAQVVAHHDAGTPPPPPPTGYAAAVLADAPVAYWRLGEASGTSAADASGHGLSGTYTGGVTLGVAGALTGDADTAVSLDGSSGYVSVSDSPALDLGNGPMSVELWLKTSAPGPAALIDKGPGAYGLSIDSDPSPGGDGLYPILWRLNAYTVVAVSNVGVTDGAWHHVVATRSADGTDNHLYIDGVDETVAGDTATMSDSAQDLRIGQSYGLDAPFAGSLDEVALYDHVLTLAQVVAHHDAGTPSGGSLAVSLGAPIPGATVFATEALSASVSGGQAPYHVDFLVDGTVVGSAAAAPYRYTWDTSGAADGTHTLSATVHDAASAAATSAPVSVTVDNALTADARIDADYTAGLIGVNDYALDGVYALGAPSMLPARYQSVTPVTEGTTEIAKYLGTWDQLDQATRDEIVAFLGQPVRGALYGATPETSSPTGSSAAVASTTPPPAEAAGITDPCEWMDAGYGPFTSHGYACTHTTAHFGITYILAGDGPFANEITAQPDRWDDDPTTQTCPDPISGSGCNGVPDYIDEVAKGLEDAWAIYASAAPEGLGYSISANWPILLPVQIDGVSGGQVLPTTGPVETIEIEHNPNDPQIATRPYYSGTPYYLAHHELFHVFQYEYIDSFSLVGNYFTYWLGLTSGPWWWMEATADWASGYVTGVDAFGDVTRYAKDLPNFLGRPADKLSQFDQPSTGRQYGASIFAEYLSEIYGPDAIRATWSAIHQEGVQQLAEPAIATVLQAAGTSFAQLLPQFAEADYFLNYGASDVGMWRDPWLQGDPRTKSDQQLGYTYDLAPARPARTRVDLTVGQPYTGTSWVHPGGSSYTEFVPPPGASALTVTLMPTSYLQPFSDLDARLLLVSSYPGTGAATFEQVPITLDPQAGGSLTIGFGTPYQYAVVVLTDTNPVDGSDDSVDIAATATQACGSAGNLIQVGAGGWSGDSGTSDAVLGCGDDAWQFTLAQQESVTISVTDCCIVGDNYAVYFDGALVGTTPAEPLYGSTSSSGTFTVSVGAGTHLVTIQDIGGIVYYDQGATVIIPAGYTVSIGFGGQNTTDAPQLAPVAGAPSHPNAP